MLLMPLSNISCRYQGMPTRSVIRKKKDGSGAVPSSETVSHQLAASLKREVCCQCSALARSFRFVLLVQHAMYCVPADRCVPLSLTT